MPNGYDQHFKKIKQVKKPPRFSKRVEMPSEESAETYLRSVLRVKPTKVSSGIGSIIMIGLAAIGLGVGVVGYMYPDALEQLPFHFQIGLFSSASAAAANTTGSTSANGATSSGSSASSQANSTATGSGDPAKPAGSAAAVDKSGCPENKIYTDEEISHFAKLNERKHELDLREAELNTLEEELHKQKKEVEDRIAKLEQIRQDVATVLKDRVEVDEKRVDTLVQFYSNMKPQQAADIISKLNEDLAVEVLGKMKKKNAADIMNLLDPTKARILSEKFTGYKRD